MSNVFLIAGPTGVGKTTYAIRLANELGALRFSIDDWMAELFYPDQSGKPNYEWFMERIGRCEALIWQMALQSLSRELPVILDLGFTTFEHRQKFRDLAIERGYEAALHVLNAPPELRWERVQQRNTEQGETFRIRVTRELFDFMEEMFEPPTPDELFNGKRIEID